MKKLRLLFPTTNGKHSSELLILTLKPEIEPIYRFRGLVMVYISQYADSSDRDYPFDSYRFPYGNPIQLSDR